MNVGTQEALSSERLQNLKAESLQLLADTWSDFHNLGIGTPNQLKTEAHLLKVKSYRCPSSVEDQATFAEVLKLSWAAEWRARDYTVNGIKKRLDPNSENNDLKQILNLKVSRDNIDWPIFHQPIIGPNGDAINFNTKHYRSNGLNAYINHRGFNANLFEGMHLTANEIPSIGNSKHQLSWSYLDGSPSQPSIPQISNSLIEELEHCSVKQFSENICLNFSSIKIEGTTDFTIIENCIFPHGLTILDLSSEVTEKKGNLNFSACNLKLIVTSKSEKSRIHLNTFSSVKAIEINSSGPKEFIIQGNVENLKLNGTLPSIVSLQGSLRITDLKCVSISIEGQSFKEVELINCEIENSLKFYQCRFKNLLWFNKKTTDKKPNVFLEDIEISEAIFVENQNFQQFSSNSKYKQFHLRNVTCLGRFDIHNASVSHLLDISTSPEYSNTYSIPTSTPMERTYSPNIFNEDSDFSINSSEEKTPFFKVNFDDTVFKGEVDFSNRDFGGSTSFRRVEFQQAILFHGADFHQDTSFRDAKFTWRKNVLWRSVAWFKSFTIDKNSQKELNTKLDTIENCFRTLRQAMDNIGNTKQEGKFLQQEHRAHHARWRSSWFASFDATIAGAYDILSEAGNSAFRPASWYFFLMFIFSFIYRSMGDGRATFETAIATSSTMMLRPFFQFAPTRITNKDLNTESEAFTSSYELIQYLLLCEELNFKLISGFQSLIATSLMFMFFVALRRKFQMS